MVSINIFKEKARTYEVICNTCDFMRTGHNPQVLRNAQDHARHCGHIVTVYTETVKVIKPVKKRRKKR